MEWRYDDIMQNGSDELKQIVQLITTGHRPGKAKEEENET